MRSFALLALCCFVPPAHSYAQGSDGVVVIPQRDAAMAEAVRKARATLPAFLESSRHPKPGTHNYAVKIGLGPAGRQEFFWIDPFVVAGDEISGRLANTPETLAGLKRGDTVRLPLAEVTDWMYIDNGAMQGNYSGCALLARESTEVQAHFQRTYGLNCAGR